MPPPATCKQTYFYPRPPCGGRRQVGAVIHRCPRISIHALRVEGDGCRWCRGALPKNFYPRPPCGGRPSNVWKHWPNSFPISIHALRVEGDPSDAIVISICRISIHALRVEGDRMTKGFRAGLQKFLSTPSVWRATLAGAVSEAVSSGFLSTPSVWRATVGPLVGQNQLFISIHALRVEGDTGRGHHPPVPSYFYPRPPCGGRLCTRLMVSP